MNVDDVMSLPKNRKPSAIDAVSLMMLRDKAYRDVVSEEFAALVAPLDQMRQAAVEALPSVAAIMSSAYEQACREAGGVGSVHAVETEGGRLAVRELVTALLQ
jgi:predicted RNase H-like nuclease